MYLLHSYQCNIYYRRTDFSGKRSDCQGRNRYLTGLAWTSVGGELLKVEVLATNGKGGLVLTGQLGDVMKESAQAGYTYIRSRAKELHLDESFMKLLISTFIYRKVQSQKMVLRRHYYGDGYGFSTD